MNIQAKRLDFVLMCPSKNLAFFFSGKAKQARIKHETPASLSPSLAKIPKACDTATDIKATDHICTNCVCLQWSYDFLGEFSR